MFNITGHSHKGNVMVNEEKKIGLLNIPKVCSTSIRIKLNLNKHLQYKDVPKDYKIFTIIRNPIDRFVSSYLEVTQDRNDGYEGGRYKYDLLLSEEKINTLENLLKSNLTELEKFKKYIELIETEWGFFEPHCIPFLYYITEKDDKTIYENLKIFKMDKLDEVENYLNIKLEKLNICKNNKLKNLLLVKIKKDKFLKRRIEELYKEDIEFYKKNN